MPPGKLVVARAPFLALVGSIFAAGTGCETTRLNAAPDGGNEPVGDETPEEDAGATPDAFVRRDATAAACEDDDGTTVPSCDGMPAPFSECYQHYCESFRTALKPRLARIAVECVKAASANNFCSEPNRTLVELCAVDAEAEACSDPSATEVCDKLRSLCADGGLPKSIAGPNKCESRVAGMTFGGRTRFIDCVTESGTANFDGCKGDGAYRCP